MNLFHNPELMKQLSYNEITESHRRHDEKNIALCLMEIYQTVMKRSNNK